MTTWLRHAVSLLLLLPFLAGTLGISAREHRCTSTNKVSLKLFPEISGGLAGCCCSGSVADPSAGGRAGSGDLDTPDCCKTIRLYFRADFQTTLSRTAKLPYISFNSADLNLLPGIKISKTTGFISLSFYSDTGPPLTGRQRVISFHQSKIPCPPVFIS